MSRKPKLTQSEMEQLSSDYVAGSTVRKLANVYSISPAAVSNLLKRLGTPARPRGRTPTPTTTSSPLHLPYMPPIVSVHDKLALIVTDPDHWHVHAIMERYDVPHAQATQWFLRLYLHLRLLGYSHLFLWKDEADKPAIQRMIAHKNRHTAERVYARKCEVVKLDKQEADAFYQEYHLQGGSTSPTNLALTYEGRVRACVGFNHTSACRGTTEGHLLQRFACSCSVPGGASKLLKAFRAEQSGQILSYSDQRYAPSGGLYRQLGFACIAENKPDYRYWRANQWYAKNAKQRRHLIAEGADPALTEHGMAAQLGYLRCYDMGKLTWVIE